MDGNLQLVLQNPSAGPLFAGKSSSKSLIFFAKFFIIRNASFFKDLFKSNTDVKAKWKATRLLDYNFDPLLHSISSFWAGMLNETFIYQKITVPEA